MLSVALATDQISSDGCYNCTGQADSYQPAVKMVTNIPYSEVVFCIDALHSISISFFIFIHPSSWLFSSYGFNKGLYFDQTLCHKVFSEYTLSFITSCFEEMFSQSRNFYENNMTLWYYQIRPKVVWKVHVAWIDIYNSQNKGKIITITKNKSIIFFPCSVSKQNHVIPHRLIAAILDVILNILQRWKTKRTC